MKDKHIGSNCVCPKRDATILLQSKWERESRECVGVAFSTTTQWPSSPFSLSSLWWLSSGLSMLLTWSLRTSLSCCQANEKERAVCVGVAFSTTQCQWRNSLWQLGRFKHMEYLLAGTKITYIWIENGCCKRWVNILTCCFLCQSVVATHCNSMGFKHMEHMAWT